MEKCGNTQRHSFSSSNRRAPEIDEAILVLEPLPDGYLWFGWSEECSLDCGLAPLPTANSNGHHTDHQPSQSWILREDETDLVTMNGIEPPCSIVPTNFPYRIEARGESAVRKASLSLGGKGRYSVALSSNNTKITITTLESPVAASEIWGPLVLAIAALVFVKVKRRFFIQPFTIV